MQHLNLSLHGWLNRPLVKVVFATEITEKMSFKNFSHRSLCALWLILFTYARSLMRKDRVLRSSLPKCSQDCALIISYNPFKNLQLVESRGGATLKEVETELLPKPTKGIFDIITIKYFLNRICLLVKTIRMQADCHLFDNKTKDVSRIEVKL